MRGTISSMRGRAWRWMVLFAGLLLGVQADAAVRASVDRADIELNETFTLQIVVEGAETAEPDLSVLADKFDVLQSNQGSSTIIVNGEISRSYNWTYTLMAKEAGQLEIPPIVVGNERSNPLFVSVSEPADELPGEADIFITAEPDFTRTYVQAQILFTIKVYRSVATRQPRLWEPSFEGIEVLVESVAEEKSYDVVLGGKTYNVVERQYALFPQESGELQIAPVRFEARVLRAGRITGRKLYLSEAYTVEVQPIPPAPEEFPGAAWLPARSVELTESWSREVDGLPAGEPITRRISVSALGQLSTQIPLVEPGVPDGIRLYPDKPELSDRGGPDGVFATRREQYAMIGTAPGTYQLPEVRLPWWDVQNATWKVASLPARQIRIEGSALPEAPVPDAVEPPAEPLTIRTEDTRWRNASLLFAVAWLITLLAWWWSRRPTRQTVVDEEVPVYRQQSRCLRRARKAALEGDAAGVKAAMLDWAKLQWPEHAPRSIGEIAVRVSAPLSGELETLSRSTYGTGGEDWSGEALARALRSFSTDVEIDERPHDRLPPLMPGD
jgi:hypothetical protein